MFPRYLLAGPRGRSRKTSGICRLQRPLTAPPCFLDPQYCSATRRPASVRVAMKRGLPIRQLRVARPQGGCPAPRTNCFKSVGTANYGSRGTSSTSPLHTTASTSPGSYGRWHNGRKLWPTISSVENTRLLSRQHNYKKIRPNL